MRKENQFPSANLLCSHSQQETTVAQDEKRLDKLYQLSIVYPMLEVLWMYVRVRNMK